MQVRVIFKINTDFITVYAYSLKVVIDAKDTHVETTEKFSAQPKLKLHKYGK
jgi:hypothetical protein